MGYSNRAMPNPWGMPDWCISLMILANGGNADKADIGNSALNGSYGE